MRSSSESELPKGERIPTDQLPPIPETVRQRLSEFDNKMRERCGNRGRCCNPKNKGGVGTGLMSFRTGIWASVVDRKGRPCLTAEFYANNIRKYGHYFDHWYWVEVGPGVDLRCCGEVIACDDSEPWDTISSCQTLNTAGYVTSPETPPVVIMDYRLVPHCYTVGWG
jgi:hypothetical protein